MPKYEFNEGSIKVPDHWRDESLHVLKSTKKEYEKTSFVISRDKTEFGESFSSFVERQIKQLESSLADFTLKNSDPVRLKAGDAHMLEFTWTNPEGKMHQIVVMLETIKRPDDEKSLPVKILVMTGTEIGGMSDETRQYFASIIRTLEARQGSIK